MSTGNECGCGACQRCAPCAGCDDPFCGCQDDPKLTRPAEPVDYEAFVRAKLSTQPPPGFDDPKVDAPWLFEWQRDIVRWALARGRAAVFAMTGTGKTREQLAWGDYVHRATGRDVLIFAPLGVTHQTRASAPELGLSVTYCAEQSDVRPGLNITNYERIEKFDPSRFVAVILDECFAAGTPVDIARDGTVERVPIERVRVGDRICNAAGVDAVSDVHRREVPYAVRIHAGGQSVVASPNHPFFTQRGWVCAQDIEPGDALVAAGEGLRMVLGRLPPADEAGAAQESVLRSILLSEMADVASGAQGEGPSPGGIREDRQIGFSAIQSRGFAETGSEPGAHPGTEANTRIACEDFPPIARDRPRTFRAWWERSRLDGASADLAGCARTELAGGVCYLAGPADSGISNELQGRLGASRAASRYRSGWSYAPQPESAGREEGREVAFTRVDRLEVLEPGHPDLERLRSPDGALYFYDIEGTRHPSFSVHGWLVHNSGRLKDAESKTRTMMTERFAATPYRLCLTATPAPNDHTELGNHAEFLGVCTRTEMLATYFVHDGGKTQDWRLKGHAEDAFWRWLCTWAIVLRRPSDLGYSDGGFELPPLNVIEHVLSADGFDPRAAGTLFALPARTLTEQRAAKRGSLSARVAYAAELVAREPHEPWVVWCELNDEQDALENALGERAVSIRGTTEPDEKLRLHDLWITGQRPVIITKSSIFGHGMNWQHCARELFVGVDHSFEKFFQAVRRCWRFRQTRAVDVHLVLSEIEREILASLRTKETAAERMGERMAAAMRETQIANVRGITRESIVYNPNQPMRLPAWLRSEP